MLAVEITQNTQLISFKKIDFPWAVFWNIQLCRTQRIFKQLGLEDYTEVNIQVLGAEDTYGPHAVNTVECLFVYTSIMTFNVTTKKFL